MERPWQCSGVGLTQGYGGVELVDAWEVKFRSIDAWEVDKRDQHQRPGDPQIRGKAGNAQKGYTYGTPAVVHSCARAPASTCRFIWPKEDCTTDLSSMTRLRSTLMSTSHASMLRISR